MRKTILLGLVLISLYSCREKETSTDGVKDIDSTTMEAKTQSDSIIANDNLSGID